MLGIILGLGCLVVGLLIIGWLVSRVGLLLVVGLGLGIVCRLLGDGRVW